MVMLFEDTNNCFQKIELYKSFHTLQGYHVSETVSDNMHKCVSHLTQYVRHCTNDLNYTDQFESYLSNTHSS